MSHWLGFGGGAFYELCGRRMDHVRVSLVCLLVFEVITSREGGAFVLDDFLKYIVHNCLRVVGRRLLSHAQNVAAFLDVVLHIVVRTLVGQLSHLDFLS